MASIKHARIPETFRIPANQIAIDPSSRTDPRITNTYAALYRGAIKTAFTRFPNSSIIPGFYLRHASGSVEHVCEFDAAFVPIEVKGIRAGFRPVLDLHWSPHAPNGGGYICPDDEIALTAYRELNIKSVPCRIIRPKPTPGAEAAIWIEQHGQYLKMARSVPPVISNYQSIVGNEVSDLPKALQRMMELCSRVRTDIKAFHEESSGGAPIHYHHTLHAMVARHERALDSVLRFVKMGRHEHALAIVRMAYEAFLNFYLDWLSPQFFGLRMQALATYRRAEINDRNCVLDWKPLSNFRGLFENAAEKARLSPLGPLYHDHAYPILSLIMHQSYDGIEAEACSFDDDGSSSPVSHAQICRWLDFLTAALLTRVGNDVGVQI
jgi:hypothetical protein